MKRQAVKKAELFDHFGDLNLVARALRGIGKSLILSEART
jgi:hypothetical protein